MILVWSALALSDRDHIFSWIEAANPLAAVVMDRRIMSATDRLLQFPRSGRPGRIAGTRELVIGHTPFISPYRIAGDTIILLRVLHGARRWPDTLPGG